MADDARGRATLADIDRVMAATLVAGNADLLVDALETADGDPLVALAASRGLTSVLGDLVAKLVGEARAGGRTWADIGQALGVTRQAVVQRFGPAAPRPRSVGVDLPAGAHRPDDPAAATARAVELVTHFLLDE